MVLNVCENTVKMTRLGSFGKLAGCFLNKTDKGGVFYGHKKAISQKPLDYYEK